MKRYLIILMFLSIFAVGCDMDINYDPNNPSSSTVDLVLPAGQASLAYIYGGQFQVLGGFWSQHWTSQHGGPQYISIDAYSISVDYFDRPWNELYAGGMNDLEWVRTEAKNQENWNYYFIATVLQCYSYQMLADLYDQIPFSEALQKVNPHFDSGQTVYDGLIQRIDEALAYDLSQSKGSVPGKDDLLFAGNMDSWVRFANTLKLKIYLRQVYARPEVTQAGIQQMAAQGAIFLTSDAAFTNYSTSPNQGNPFCETEFFRFGGINVGASKTVIDTLLGNDDARIDALFYLPSGSTTHAGMLQGYGPNLQSTPLEISIEKISSVSPVYFITAAESYFLQAEAAARGYLGGDAASLYNSGIAASFSRLGVTATTAYAYPASSDFEVNLEAIIFQKWLSMTNIQGLEAFFEYNRTHYPTILIPSVSSVLPSSQMPKRLWFPQAEVQTNPNTPTQPAGITTKVWWDKK